MSERRVCVHNFKLPEDRLKCDHCEIAELRERLSEAERELRSEREVYEAHYETCGVYANERERYRDDLLTILDDVKGVGGGGPETEEGRELLACTFSYRADIAKVERERDDARAELEAVKSRLEEVVQTNIRYQIELDKAREK